MSKEENNYELLLNDEKAESESSKSNGGEKEEKITDDGSQREESDDGQSVKSDRSDKSKRSEKSKSPRPKNENSYEKKRYKSESQIRKEKKYMLQKINYLRQDYPTIKDNDPTEYNINTGYEELEEGLQDAINEKDFQDARDYYRTIIVFGSQGIEKLNSVFGRGAFKLNLNGFSQSTSEDIFIYDPELREIHEKYGGYTTKTPVEIRLVIKMIRSAFAYSATKQTLQEAYPQVNADQLMKENPELAAKVEEKVFEQMQKNNNRQGVERQQMYEVNKYQQPQMQDLKIEKEMNDILNQVDIQAKNINAKKSLDTRSNNSQTIRTPAASPAPTLTRESMTKKKRGRKSKAQKEQERQEQEQASIARSPSQQSVSTNY